MFRLILRVTFKKRKKKKMSSIHQNKKLLKKNKLSTPKLKSKNQTNQTKIWRKKII